MKINPHLGDLDPTQRRRQVEARRAADHADAATKSSRGDPAASTDLALRKADIDRFVALLRDMDPVDLHRVEDIRRRIEDGSYSSDLGELIDPLLAFLEDDTVA